MKHSVSGDEPQVAIHVFLAIHRRKTRFSAGAPESFHSIESVGLNSQYNVDERPSEHHATQDWYLESDLSCNVKSIMT